MSLCKDECASAGCWLPPQPNKTICRKCDIKDLHQIQWIRYHTPSTVCKKYRDLILSDTYFGSALPEDCIQCCNFLIQFPIWAAPLKIHIKQSSHDKLTNLFMKELEERREALLDYITNLLELFTGDTETSRRLINALLSASNGREKWILEELVQRPILYSILLTEPLHIPYHLTEDFYGYYEAIEQWWGFWEKMPASTKRHIRFRCLTFKEELLEKTWHPDRVLNWCFAIDEALNIY